MTIVVLCPMQIERRAVERALRSMRGSGARVVQTGIGKDAIVAALERDAGNGAADTLYVLAGACGGLIETLDVPGIARVIDEHGGSWRPRFADERGVMLVAVDRVVATPREKRELAQRTGAAIVDMETHAFAAECERRGLAWTVVRGVSDTPDETLPAEVLGWVTPAGGTRAARAVRDMAMRPWLVPHVMGVMRRANRVLPRVGARVAEIAERWRAGERGVVTAGPSAAASFPVPVGTPLVMIVGGTFDPPHVAHTVLPARARDELETRAGAPGRAWLLYVPAARSPHKQAQAGASGAQRIEMARLAVRGVERAAVCNDEVARSGPGEASYTVETVERARAALDARGDTATLLRLVIGADQAGAFHRWREPRRIIELAEPVVLSRGGQGDAAAIVGVLQHTGFWTEEELGQWAGRVVDVGLIEASSTAVRDAFAAGQPERVAAIVDPAVMAFIRENGLYAVAPHLRGDEPGAGSGTL